MTKVSVRKFIDDYVNNGSFSLSGNDHMTYIKEQGYICIKVQNNIEHSLDSLKLFAHKLNAIDEWLMENIGYDNFNRTGPWIWFDSEEDAIYFSLRWL